ncbi:radical SAM protein [Nocardiopsis mangrovi]|uniref:Radical SAM protein n=1 Tax=Nocardiopsis mangrovi TaxID=1179818 RepID=A0ABV9DND6_9ACTN
MTAILPEKITAPLLDLLFLDLTRKCQLECVHCYNDSGPRGGHGIMIREDWIRTIDQAAAQGVRRIQMIGGEPTMHPDFAELVTHALNAGIQTEVFSNLVHVSPANWTLFQRPGVSLATSYYSDSADEHDAVTGRRSHARTRANIVRAVGFKIPLRVGIIAASDEQRVAQARAELESMGVAAERIRVDRAREFGRAGNEAPDTANLCGRCGTGRAAVGPDGTVSPCVMSSWMRTGNVQAATLADILMGPEMERANAAIRTTVRAGACDPDAVDDDTEDECTPGVPGSECSPRN